MVKRFLINQQIMISNGQGHDYTTGCVLDYPYFKENYKTIAMMDIHTFFEMNEV